MYKKAHPQLARLIPVLLSGFLLACGGEQGTRIETTASDTEIHLEFPFRQIRAINPSQVDVQVTINNNDPLAAVYTSNGGWSVRGLNREDYSANNTVSIVWTEQVNGQSLLLAEFNGAFTVGQDLVIDPLGNFIVDGESRFDSDLDGVSNLAERASEPPSDPFLQSSYPVPEMVSISAGCFDMGSPESESRRSRDEGPLFDVCVNNFLIGKYEVTFAQYDAFAAQTDRIFPSGRQWGRGNRPVIGISAEDAIEYADWLSGETGQNFRLPTEAEWEYAARAGTVTAFNTGTDLTAAQANFNGTYEYNGVTTGLYLERTLPVGNYAPNAFGLYDMHGNVAEMTCSRYRETYNGAEQVCSTLSGSLTYAYRGGSWLNGPVFLRSASRGERMSDSTSSYIGFRLVRE